MQEIIVRYREEDPKTDRWQLVEPIYYSTSVGLIRVPAGYITDFASVPPLLWGLFPPIGRHCRASVLHDYWYDNRLFEAQLGAKAARLLADQELLKRLNECRPSWKRRNYLMYLACRWFGRSWWEN